MGAAVSSSDDRLSNAELERRTQHNANSILFSLPPEIRHMIYEPLFAYEYPIDVRSTDGLETTSHTCLFRHSTGDTAHLAEQLLHSSIHRLQCRDYSCLAKNEGGYASHGGDLV